MPPVWRFRDTPRQFLRERFADVTPAYGGSETIAWGVERGLVSGYPDGTFKPEQPTHDDVTDFSEGMAMVRIGYRCGFIDRSGKMAVPPLYDDAKSFSEGLAPVRLKGKFGYVDKTGRMVIEPQFAYAEPFQNGLARVEDESHRIFYIDQTGKRVTE